jgi:hypothetical protein
LATVLWANDANASEQLLAYFGIMDLYLWIVQLRGVAPSERVRLMPDIAPDAAAGPFQQPIGCDDLEGANEQTLC